MNFYPFDIINNWQSLRCGFYTFNERNILLNSSNYDLPHILSLENKNNKDFENWQKPENCWDIIFNNHKFIENDLKIKLANSNENYIYPDTNHYINKENVFIEQGAEVNYCNLNAADGAIYISKNALIMEGSSLRGPIFIGENSVIKLNTTIYGATTIGPKCVIGGEVKNSIFMGFSNKAHHGYIGDSIIGYWCNLGAGTSNSNIKNTASDIKVFNKTDNNSLCIGQKAGLLFGDYSRCAINTAFNTGTTIGAACNIVIKEVNEKHIASFSWNNEKYKLEELLTHIENWMNLKNEKLSAQQKQIIVEAYSKK